MFGQIAVSEEMQAWAKKNVPLLDWQLETKQFIDHFTAKGETAKDWTAKWRTWQRNAFTEFGKYPKGKPSLNQTNGQISNKYDRNAPTTKQVENTVRLNAIIADSSRFKSPVLR